MTPGISVRDLLRRAFLCRCPRCGEGKIFVAWAVPHTECVQCGFPFRKREPDTWFFMYMSTAGLTGFFLILFFVIAKESMVLRFLIPALAAAFFILTIPVRKALAFGLDYRFQPSSDK